MKVAKVICKCGAQICYIEEFIEQGNFQQREFDLLTEQGYDVIIGEDLERSEPCLEPCYEREDCAFSRHFSTYPGFKNVFSWDLKVCSKTTG